MSTAEVKKTLSQEADLLEHLIKCIEDFNKSDFTGQADYIATSWARFLGERRDTNRSLAAAGDQEVHEDLLYEFSQVTGLVEALHASPSYTEFWRKFLECEQDILKRLVARCDKY